MAAVVLAGCGGDPNRLAVHPVTGSLSLDGVPASGASVVFHATGGAVKDGDKASGEPIRPNATVKSDGSFELSTYGSGDGAPEGDYLVTVQWFKLVTKGKDSSAGPNVIPVAYSNPRTTPLKATVKPEATTIEPFALKSK